MNNTEEHDRIVNLLPWLINGTLTDRERSIVEEHVSSCIECRRVVRDESLLAKNMRLDGERDLAKATGFRSLEARLTAEESRIGRSWLRQSKYAAAAAIVAVAVGWIVKEVSTQPVARFETLTEFAAGASRIDVIFLAGADESKREAFFTEFSVGVVSGPTELGRYTVAPINSGSVELEALIRAMRDDERVRFAARSFVTERP